MIAALLLLLPQAAVPAAPPPEALREQDLRAHIGFLASDELEGRESGERGGRLAALYCARWFERLGLEPVGPEGFLLPFRNRRTGGRTFYNAGGLLPGTDPALADEILVIGGHHDHAGIGGPGAMGFPGEIHNGADDNASGAAGVLELAEYFVAHPTRRPILFLTFAGEESGLLGSQWFVESGPVPRERIRAMLNLDMVGRSRNGYLFLGGLGTAREFHDLLDPVLEESRLRLELSDLGEAPSDNSSFYRAGIPSLFFFTHIHEDYHMPGDDPEKIDYAAEVRILDLVRRIAETLNNTPSPLTWKESPGMGMPADFQQRMMEHFQRIAERRQQQGRLGILQTTEEGGLVRVGAVRPGGAAEAAGLQAGDRILELDGRRVRSLDDLRRALGGHLKGDTVPVTVEREGQRLELQVTLR